MSNRAYRVYMVYTCNTTPHSLLMSAGATLLVTSATWTAKSIPYCSHVQRLWIVYRRLALTNCVGWFVHGFTITIFSLKATLLRDRSYNKISLTSAPACCQPYINFVISYAFSRCLGHDKGYFLGISWKHTFAWFSWQWVNVRPGHKTSLHFPMFS